MLPVTTALLGVVLPGRVSPATCRTTANRHSSRGRGWRGGGKRRTIPCLPLHVFTSSRITSCPRYSSVTSFEVHHLLTRTQPPSRPCPRPIPFPAPLGGPHSSSLPSPPPSLPATPGQQGRDTGVGRELSRTNLIRAFNGYSFEDGLRRLGVYMCVCVCVCFRVCPLLTSTSNSHELSLHSLPGRTKILNCSYVFRVFFYRRGWREKISSQLFLLCDFMYSLRNFKPPP